MLGIAGSSYAPFALVWAALCLFAGALVTDALLRGTPSAAEAEPAAEEVPADA